MVGHDCGREQKCLPGCQQHGVCVYGLCYCDPGYEGEACEVPLSCPGECSGHGECANAKCYCADGWRGLDCSQEAPLTDSGIVGAWSCALLQLPIAGFGVFIGWAIKHALEQRQRAKMREILQADAQRPFMSQQ